MAETIIINSTKRQNMSNINSTLDFSLGNEILRLEKANSFDLYILKSQIEKALSARKIASYSKKMIHPLKCYVYFDKDTEKEEILTSAHTQNSSNLIYGIRSRDSAEVKVCPEAIDLSRCYNPSESEADTQREHMKESWKCEYRTRIAYERYVHLGNSQKVRAIILGYLAKWNHGTIRMQLLSGEPILMKERNIESHIYHPTEAEHLLFDKYESDIEHQKVLKNNIYKDIHKYIEEHKDKKYSHLKNGLLKHLSLYGHDLDLTEECFLEVYSNSNSSKEGELLDIESIKLKDMNDIKDLLKGGDAHA